MTTNPLPGYDAWKTMSPDEEAERTTLRGECDCCGEVKPRLWRVVAHGIETYACAECCHSGEDAEDDR